MHELFVTWGSVADISLKTICVYVILCVTIWSMAEMYVMNTFDVWQMEDFTCLSSLTVWAGVGVPTQTSG